MTDTTPLHIDGATMVSTREAARRVGLSYDYIARLVRQHKVFGVKVGRAWYVDETSLERYLETVELEKQVRTKLLQVERRHELAVRTQQYQSSTRSPSTIYQSVVGFGQSVSVLTLAALLGVLLHTAYEDQTVSTVAAAVTQSSVMNQFWSGIDGMLDAPLGPTNTAPPESYGVATSSQEPSVTQITEDSSQSVATVIGAGPLVLLGSTTRSDEVAYLQSLFSDPVRVELADDGVRGTIQRYATDGTTGEPVEFLLVPNESVVPE